MGCLGNHSLELTGLAGDPASPVHRLDPRAKILGLVAVTLVAVSTPLEAWPVFGACALVLACVATAGRVSGRDIWRRVRLCFHIVLLAALSCPSCGAGAERTTSGRSLLTRRVWRSSGPWRSRQRSAP